MSQMPINPTDLLEKNVLDHSMLGTGYVKH